MTLDTNKKENEITTQQIVFGILLVVLITCGYILSSFITANFSLKSGEKITFTIERN